MSQSYLKGSEGANGSGKSGISRRKKKQSLAMRLAEACAAIPVMDKLGTNNPEYDYVYASQIFAAFRKELLDRDILLLPDEKEVTEKDIPTVAGPILRQVTLQVEYELIDCRGLEPSIKKTAFGVGMDHGDKAIYKAKTGALKYFFRVLGIIPWLERDNPEADVSIDEATDPRLYEKDYDKKTAKQRRIQDRQIRAFDSACHASGKTAEQVADYLKTKFQCATVADLQRADFDTVIKWATGAPEALVDGLETSIKAIQGSVTAITGKKRGQPVVEILDRKVRDEVDVAGD
jgi:hypothetical protein